MQYWYYPNYLHITYTRLSSHVPVNTEQVRPKFLPTAYSYTSYSTWTPHDLSLTPITNMIRPPIRTDTGTTYRPPWPPPYDTSGFSTSRHVATVKPGYLWPHHQYHLQCPTIGPTSGYLSQASYRLYPIRPRLLLQCCTPYSYSVSPPTSLVEDKNLLRPP